MKVRVAPEACALLVLMTISGCVSAEQYGATVRETQEAYQQYDSARHRTTELAAENHRLQMRVLELEAAIRDAHEQLQRVEREYRDMKEQSLRFKSQTDQTTDPAPWRDMTLAVHRPEPPGWRHGEAAGRVA